MKSIRRSPLLVKDNPGTLACSVMLNEVESHNTELTHVSYLRDAEIHLAQHPVDVVLLDLGLPDAQRLKGGPAHPRRLSPGSPSGSDGDRTTILWPSKALQEGAQDYLVKGQIDTRGLQRAIRYAIERKIMDEALFVEKERAQVTLNSNRRRRQSAPHLLGETVTFLNVVAENRDGMVMAVTLKGLPFDRSFADSRRHHPGDHPVNPHGDGGSGRPHRASPANSILIRRDGFEIPIEDSVAPSTTVKGRLPGAVIVFRDVSAARAMALQMPIRPSTTFSPASPIGCC